MTVDRTGLAPPRRGTRPRNRRALIIEAARDLFHRRGYDHVSMGDIAEAVAIGPSALYRHFPGKQQLLLAVIRDGIAPVRGLLVGTDFTDRATALPALAGFALDHRELGVLWQRETRHIAAADRDELRAELREFGRASANSIRAARPDLTPAGAGLLAWAMSAVLLSPSFHHLDRPRPDYERLLAELTATVLDTEVPVDFETVPAAHHDAPVLMPTSRREALLAQAIRMFASRGYSGVGIEDIGAGVGIAGPSIYNHVGSKLELLITAFDRGSAALYLEMNNIYATAADATDALRRLIRSYVEFAGRNHHVIDLMITEGEHLPDDERNRARQAQHSYIDEWVHLLRQVHPDLDRVIARIRVHAALNVANDAARTPHLRRNPGAPAVLEEICTRLLRLPA